MGPESRNVLEVLAMLLVAVVIPVVVVLVHQVTAVAREALRSGPFLGGGAPSEHAVSRYHARWYPLAVLFLAFDVEMLFMYPWAVVVASFGVEAVVEMFAFLTLLMTGVAYCWRAGVLRWA